MGLVVELWGLSCRAAAPIGECKSWGCGQTSLGNIAGPIDMHVGWVWEQASLD